MQPRFLFWLLAVGALQLGFLGPPGTAEAAPQVDSSPPEPIRPVAALNRFMAEAQEALEVNEFQVAESRYRSALLEAWLLRGGLDVLEEDLSAAHHAFEQALAASFETRRPRVSLALVQLQKGETEKAIGGLRRVVAQNPRDQDARRKLAQALVADGRPAEALQELQEALVQQPQDAETTFALASGYLRHGDPRRATELFDRLRQLRPIPQTDILIGRVYRDERFFDLARQAFESALELDPKVPRAHYYLATVDLLEAGRDILDPAMERLRQELRLHPDDPITNLYLGMALSESMRFEEAFPFLEKALAWPITRLDALRFKGRCQLRTGRLAEAIESLTEALALAEASAARPSQLATIAYQLAQSYRQSGSEARAQVYFARAEAFNDLLIETDRSQFDRMVANHLNLETGEILDRPLEAQLLEGLAPNQRLPLRRQLEQQMARAYFNLGVLHLKGAIPSDLGAQRAAEHFVNAAHSDPDYPQVQFSLGATYFQIQRFSLAVPPLEKALAEAPQRQDIQRMLAIACLNSGQYPRAAALLAEDEGRSRDRSLQYAYGLALVRSGQTDRASSIFGRLLEEHRNWPELHVLMGQAHAQRDDYDQAFASLEEALGLDPKVADAHETLGNLYLRQGELDSAETAFRNELLIDPGDLQARYLLATVLDLNRKADLAQQELRQVLARQPDFADGRYLLGKILLAGGDAEAARAQLEAAAQLAPEDPNIFYQLGQACQRLGKRELAQEHFATYSQLKRQQRQETP